MVRSHQEECHDSLPSVVILNRQHKSGFPQQIQNAEVGLQTDLIRVLKGLLQISSLDHTGYLHIQRESSDSQVHDLGTRLQGNGNQCPGLLLGSSNLVIPPGPSQSSSSRGGLRTRDQGNSDLSRVEGSNVVASAGQTEDRNGSNLTSCSSGLRQVSQREYGGAPQL